MISGSYLTLPGHPLLKLVVFSPGRPIPRLLKASVLFLKNASLFLMVYKKPKRPSVKTLDSTLPSCVCIL